MSADHGAYLRHLLFWTLPIVFGQGALLAFTWRGKLKTALRAALPPVAAMTVYLVVADHLAIRAGVWHFDPNQILGVYLGAVPIEEALFFLITNLLVAQGLLLFWKLRVVMHPVSQ